MRRIYIGLVASIVLLLGAAVADVTGVLRPRPSSSALVQRMSEAWEALPGYRGLIIMGNLGRGKPEGSDQWFTKGQDLVLIATDRGGFKHLERWSKTGAWDYYQPGAGFEAKITVSGVDKVPYARWAISRLPTLEDVVHVVQNAKEPRVVGWERIKGTDAWILECTPTLPDRVPSYSTYEPGEAFHQVTFGRPWRVWVAAANGLPMRVLIGTEDSGQTSVIEVMTFQPGPAVVPPVWREVFQGETAVKSRFELTCDALSPKSIDAVRENVLTRVNAWRHTIFMQGRPGGPPQTSPPDSP